MFVQPVRPLHMHRPIIMSHNIVTEIQKILSRVIIDTPLPFCGAVSSVITYCTGSVQITYKAIQHLHLNLFPVSSVGREEICRDKSVWIEHATSS
jgi:hypothetical protein